VDARSRNIVDVGCGDGQFLELMTQVGVFGRLTGVDVSQRSLATAREHLPTGVELLATSIDGIDGSFRGFDAAVLIEVIEHLSSHQLRRAEQTLFGLSGPRLVLLTTPNADGRRSPPDWLKLLEHQFEWNSAEFHSWGRMIAATYGYSFTPCRITGPSFTRSSHFGRFERIACLSGEAVQPRNSGASLSRIGPE
jgi:SAM-dependent methyltransferase